MKRRGPAVVFLVDVLYATFHAPRETWASSDPSAKHERGSGSMCLRVRTYIIQISQLTSPEKPNQPLIERENEIPLPAARLTI